MPARIALHWFRKDLRLTDNTALHHAAKDSAQVIPVYILSTWKTHHQWTGAKRQHFLAGCLDSLCKNLDTLGSRLILRAGDACQELEKLLLETKATDLYFNRDYDPYGRAMETQVLALCDRLGVTCHHFKDRVLHEAPEVLTGSGTEYRVYTPYSRNWLSLPKPSPLPRVTARGPQALHQRLWLKGPHRHPAPLLCVPRCPG